ncbi:unnamed protein product, partial [Amoebophrya sp. A120]|eukprot:GSA120T00019247001.1
MGNALRFFTFNEREERTSLTHLAIYRDSEIVDIPNSWDKKIPSCDSFTVAERQKNPSFQKIYEDAVYGNCKTTSREKLDKRRREQDKESRQASPASDLGRKKLENVGEG